VGHDTVRCGKLISFSDTLAASLIRPAVTAHSCTCGLQSEAAGFSKTLAHTYQTTRCHVSYTQIELGQRERKVRSGCVEKYRCIYALFFIMA
jgi:hypothetical protein